MTEVHQSLYRGMTNEELCKVGADSHLARMLSERLLEHVEHEEQYDRVTLETTETLELVDIAWSDGGLLPEILGDRLEEKHRVIEELEAQIREFEDNAS